MPPEKNEPHQPELLLTSRDALSQLEQRTNIQTPGDMFYLSAHAFRDGLLRNPDNTPIQLETLVNSVQMSLQRGGSYYAVTEAHGLSGLAHALFSNFPDDAHQIDNSATRRQFSYPSLIDHVFLEAFRREDRPWYIYTSNGFLPLSRAISTICRPIIDRTVAPIKSTKHSEKSLEIVNMFSGNNQIQFPLSSLISKRAFMKPLKAFNYSNYALSRSKVTGDDSLYQHELGGGTMASSADIMGNITDVVSFVHYLRQVLPDQVLINPSVMRRREEILSDINALILAGRYFDVFQSYGTIIQQYELFPHLCSIGRPYLGSGGYE